MSGPVALDEERLKAAARNSAREKGEQKDKWVSSGHVARRSLERYTLGLWLEDRKVGSQVIGENRNRFPGKGTVGKVRRERRASNRAKKRVYRFRVSFGRER